MKNLYRFLFLITLVAFGNGALAQNAGMLSGSIKDDKGTEVGFATVAILAAADAKVITGGVTDAAGRFEIKAPSPGKYLLRVTAIGYTQTDTPPFEVTGADFKKDFGALTLKTDTKTLKEVSVQALRPNVRNEADKMVVSVEGTAMAAGNSAYDVLAKSPGVYVDQDGNIQLNGKGGIRIMIDGKPSYLSGKELQTMLQGMSAENLKDLEIITNPSAKYDAEGTAGIININLKKNTIVGFNGSLYTGYQYNGLTGYSTGGNINHKKGKWNSFVNVDVAQRTQLRDNTMTREFLNEGSRTYFDQVGHEEGIRFIPSTRLGIDYDINKNHSIGVMANLMHFEADNEFITDTYLTNPNKPSRDVFVNATNLINGAFNNGSFNAHYLGKLDSVGTTFSADLDFAALRDKRKASFLNFTDSLDVTKPNVSDLSRSYNLPQFNIYSAKVDFVKPFTKTRKLEMGLKASHVVSDSDLQFYNVIDAREVVDKGRTSHFIYTENVYAAYANLSANFGDKWKLMGGLRAEQTDGVGELLNSNQPKNKRDYLNFFPSLFITQNVNKNYTLSYNYSRRINRPRYESMNPFFFYLDKFTSAQGNPNLKPQYTDSYEVKQTIKNTYILTAGYARTKDFIAEIPEQFADNTTIFQQRNVNKFENYNATIVAPVKVAKFWDISNNITLAHQDYTIIIKDRALRNQQFFTYAQSTSNIQLPKAIKLEANLAYQGKSAYGLYKIGANWGLDLGVKRSFLKNNLDVSVNASDIFRTRRIVGVANYNGEVNEFDQYFGQQSIRFNVRYRFAKGKQFEAKRRNNSLDELNRAGGN